MSDYNYLGVQQIADDTRYPFTIGQIRQHLLRRHLNGLEIAVRKIGKRCYVRKDLFDQWIESHCERKTPKS